ncbi:MULTISPECIES: CapA family protein [Corallococcus]|uniref:CapA family protein n=1 Tax=Corallococcus TaxID=83461 RepID=UPI000EA234BC|nr:MULTISPECIES: CapA family protein [Corallococcus]NRD54677.1 CapA family protein [Corallococcus exiguus]RKH28455.1 CapA family protein [Corallococcus sp. CA041A]
MRGWGALLVFIPLWGMAAPARVELVFGGDVIPHGEVKSVAKAHAGSGNHEGWDHVFGPLSDVLRTADVGVVNLETPVTANTKAFTKELVFNAPPSMVQALVNAGVKVVSTGNNHARDQHVEGLVETLRHLDAAGLRHTGTGTTRDAAWEPVFMEVRGLKLGFLSFTRSLNGFSNPKESDAPHVALLPYPEHASRRGLKPEEALERVRAAAAKCDALFVMGHWGREYTDTPHPLDRALGQSFLEAGAFAVIGHHPHVLQPLEAYTTKSGRRGFIAYSLGNLVANQARFYRHVKGQLGKDGDKRDTLLLRVGVTRAEPGAPVSLADVSVLPVWIENNAQGRKAKAKRNIQPVLIDREIEEVSRRLAALTQRTATPDKTARAEKAALEQRLASARYRRERILRMLPAEFRVATPELRRRDDRAVGLAAQTVP